jgi:hypothetical protein
LTVGTGYDDQDSNQDDVHIIEEDNGSSYVRVIGENSNSSFNSSFNVRRIDASNSSFSSANSGLQVVRLGTAVSGMDTDDQDRVSMKGSRPLFSDPINSLKGKKKGKLFSKKFMSELRDSGKSPQQLLTEEQRLMGDMMGDIVYDEGDEEDEDDEHVLPRKKRGEKDTGYKSDEEQPRMEFEDLDP